MQFYFTKLNPSDKNFRGRERTTLPTTLANDLDTLNTHTRQKHLTDHTYSARTIPKLRNMQDLEDIRTLAQDRQAWCSLTSSILEARRAASAVVEAAGAS